MYRDQPAAGEKPDSEALASTADQLGDLFVAGIVDTQREDTDGLILRFYNGKFVWRRRISGPGHDCDRPLGLLPDNEGGVYVTGETYVPRRPGLCEGWRLFVARYRGDGRIAWYHQPDIVIKKDLHAQVITDHQNGLVVAATEHSNNAERVLFLHYGPQGNLLHTWRYPAHGGAQTSFVRLCESPEGRLFVCAIQTSQESSKASPASRWAIACFNLTGRMLWERFCEGQTKGHDEPAGICGDRNGSVYVAGTYSVGNPTDGTASACPVIVKYTSEGTPLWQRMYAPLRGDCYVNTVTCTDDGRVVTLAGDAMTSQRNIAAFALSYSDLGTLLRSFKDPLTSGYRSSAVRSIVTSSAGDPTLITALSFGSAAHFLDNCELALLSLRPGETEWETKTFTQTSHTSGWTMPRFAITTENALYTGGRLPAENGSCALFVVGLAAPSR